MKLQIKEPASIEDGKHEGIIVAIEYRHKPHNYTDLVIEFEKGKKLKAGYPTMVHPVTMLGKIMLAFGAALEIGKEIEPEDVFVGKRCTFLTVKDGQFANIVRESLKPIE